MRWLISWTLYLLGDGVSRLMNLAEPLGRLYPIYSRLITASSHIQGDTNNSPWIDE